MSRRAQTPAARAFDRLAADILDGLAFWVARHPDYELSHDRAHAGPPSVPSPEQKRARERERKARQREQARLQRSES
ncbi:hypothetical protein [Caballeronia terrestris]|uniref:hypothetical protein n=1 Tax=Caballeronia terrestris TaxID=1226301 RepID=UPI000F738D41|nr:hypothetical protein [Caballeronia terrestris]